MVVPFPNPPYTLYPQHLAAPLVSTAHVRRMPAVMEATPDDKPVTGAGTTESMMEPFPSSPFRFNPQHFAAPLVSTAHVCVSPALICFTVPAPLPPVTASVRVVMAVAPVLSRTVARTVAIPPVVGVPAMAPLLLRVSPVGRPVAVQV